MKAIGYVKQGALEDPAALIEFEADRPKATGRDLLVRIQAVSVNPVDYKLRMRAAPEDGQPKVLGFDAVGEVVETGPDVTGFSQGDMVWYAGAIDRPGTNCEFHLVDERIVAKKPASIPNAQAAALPLTSLTAWEMLFDRLRVDDPVPGAAPVVVIIGGAGGVGSIAIQLLRARTDLTVIATASRPETQQWVKDLGAHHAVDHAQPLPGQIEALGIGAPGYIFSTTHTQDYVSQIADLIAPQGRFGLIDDPDVMDVMPFKVKAVSTHWELMFTRPLFKTADMDRQGQILAETAALIDAGKIRSTATETMGKISAANLREAHLALAANRTRGKIVLEGF